VAGAFSIEVSDPHAFVADPLAWRSAAATVARLAQVGEHDIEVGLAVGSVPAEVALAASSAPAVRRLRAADVATGAVTVGYRIRVPIGHAEPAAANLRTTPVVDATRVFVEELAKAVAQSAGVGAVAGDDTSALVAQTTPYSIVVLRISAQANGVPKTEEVGKWEDDHKGGLPLPMVAGVVSAIMGVFCIVQCFGCFGCATGRSSRCGECVAEMCSRREPPGGKCQPWPRTTSLTPKFQDDGNSPSADILSSPPSSSVSTDSRDMDFGDGDLPAAFGYWSTRRGDDGFTGAVRAT